MLPKAARAISIESADAKHVSQQGPRMSWTPGHTHLTDDSFLTAGTLTASCKPVMLQTCRSAWAPLWSCLPSSPLHKARIGDLHVIVRLISGFFFRSLLMLGYFRAHTVRRARSVCGQSALSSRRRTIHARTCGLCPANDHPDIDHFELKDYQEVFQPCR
jgi:hypothetical protein